MKKAQSQNMEKTLPTINMIITQEDIELPLDFNKQFNLETKLTLDSKTSAENILPGDDKKSLESDNKPIISEQGIPSKESFNQKLLIFEQGNRRLRGRRKDPNDEIKEAKHKEEEKPEDDLLLPLKSKTVQPSSNLMSCEQEETLEKNQTMNLDEKEKTILRSKMNKCFKRANIVEDGKRNNDNQGTIPSKDINPNDLFPIDKLKKDISYTSAQKAYDLNILTDSHKFMKNKLDKIFVNLVKRQIINFERNLKSIENDKFFILYELQVTILPHLCLTDITTLKVIKSLLVSFPSVHLIIMFSDEELFNNNSKEYDYSLIKDFAQEKFANILIYLNLDSNDEKRVHAFSTKMFKTKDEDFEVQKDGLFPLLDKPKVRKLFNLTKKEEEKNNLLLNYPCYLAVAANPSIYTNYIPEIKSNHRCLIINSIFYMNRYHMCFDAAKILGFNDPAVLALKIVPPISGINGKEAYYNFDEENALLTSDEKMSLNMKIEKMASSEGRNPNIDIICQYYAFLEDDNENYNFIIKKYKEGEDEVKIKIASLFQDILKIFKEKDVNDIDITKFMINY